MKPTVSIGIAAFNESENIGALLWALQKQIITCAKLTEIVVVSDCSDDGTDDIVRSFFGVTLIRLTARSGLNTVHETIRVRASSDILIFMDADVIPVDAYMVDRLIEPLARDTSIGLTSARLIPARPQTFLEKILTRNHMFKTQLFKNIGTGNNIYTCYGPARAFYKKLYSGVEFHNNCPSDAMSYLLCIQHGMRFEWVEGAAVVFRCPATLKDHIKQSSRFISGQKTLTALFGEEAERAYRIPRTLLVQKVILEVMIHPILFTGFLVVRQFVQQSAPKAFTSKWEMSPTSKRV